jgi:hypothetical protein
MDEEGLDARTEAEIVQLLLCGEQVLLMVQDFLRNGVAEGHVEVNGRRWRLWLAPEDN